MADFGGGFVAILAGVSSFAHHLASLLSQDLKLEMMNLSEELPNENFPKTPSSEIIQSEPTSSGPAPTEIIPSDLASSGSAPAETVQSETIFSGSTSSDGCIRRVLAGTIPGENVSLNGTVIAKASSSSVEIKAKMGRIVEIKGAVPKLHGLEKLPERIDIETAILRSGDIRRTERKARSLKWTGKKVALIDHAAESTFEKAKGAGVVITVGDDTTAIAGDVLARLGIPLIGIVDGDLDQLSHRTSKPPGSVIITVLPGRDDVVGRRIKETIFRGESQIELNSHGIEGLVCKVEEVAGDDLLSIKNI